MMPRVSSLFKRAWVRVLAQGFVSLVLIIVLVVAARSTNLTAGFRTIELSAIAIALGLLFLGFILNSWRWQMLLANVGVQQHIGSLIALYFIGLFFSLFLPTGTGGDIVRAYEVGRRSGRFSLAILGTLQERLLGLGASLLIGLVATIYYLPIVPPQLRAWMVIIQIVGAAGIVLLLYPALLFAITNRLWLWLGQRPAIRRIAERPVIARAIRVLQPIHELPPLPLPRLLLLVAISIIAVLMGIGMYYVIGQSLGIQVGFIAFCLVVPLVWIIRMAPISLNGIGVSEGTFVFLMSWFAIPADKALVLALAILGLQTLCALLGGLLLALRIARGTWLGVQPFSKKSMGDMG